MSEPPEGRGVSVSTVWANVDDVPVLPANTFVTQMGGFNNGVFDPAILNVGFTAPPFVLGSPEEQRAMMNAIGAIPVRALGRYQLTRERLGELIQLLQGLAVAWDQAQQQFGGGGLSGD